VPKADCTSSLPCSPTYNTTIPLFIAIYLLNDKQTLRDELHRR